MRMKGFIRNTLLGVLAGSMVLAGETCAFAGETEGAATAETEAEASDHVMMGLQSYNLVMGGDFGSFKSQDDVDQMLTQLADAGYEGVEWCNFMFGGMYDYIDLDATKAKMDELGIKTTGMHFHFSSFDTLADDAAACVDRMKKLGTDQLIFAYSIPDLFGIQPDEDGNWTPEQVDEWAADIDKVLDALRTASEGTGFQVLYHNHNTEFLKGTEGKYALDMIHPDALEVDVYWASKGLDGKVDTALQYVKDHDDMVNFLHVKDGLDGSKTTGEMCGWGKGTYDIQKIIDTAKESSHIKWVIVENDNPQNFGQTGVEDALDSASYAKENLNFAK